MLQERNGKWAYGDYTFQNFHDVAHTWSYLDVMKPRAGSENSPLMWAGPGQSAGLKILAQTRNIRACGPMLYIIYT